MWAALRRAACRYFHGGFLFDGTRCIGCNTYFKDREEAGLLREFLGRVRLDEYRMLDLEVERVKTFAMDGYRVMQGGKVIKEWGQPPARKILKPIPISLVNRSQAGGTKR